ncbi:MAG: MFS transporter [Acidobacteriaceae bacterium]|nr:MFS transporter [Acidobacteriaceae bacterium]
METTTSKQRASHAATFTLLFVACFTVMVGSVISPALPAIAEQLHWPWSPGWLVTLPSLGVVLFGPAVGPLIERLGARLVLLLGLVLYGILGVLAAVVPLSATIIAADRLLLGGATALVMAAGTTLIAALFVGAARLRMIALQGMAIELGGVVFLALGGWLGEHGWRLPFALYALAWICALCTLLTLPAHTAAQHEDLTETTRKRTHHILVEATLCMTIFFVAYTTLPLALASRFGYTEARTGYLMAWISVVAVASAAMLPRLSKSIALGKLVPLALLLFAAGHLTLARAHTLATILIGLTLLGIGFAFAIPVVNHEMIERSSAAQRGRNLGLLSMAIFLGQFLSTFAGLFSADSFTTLRLTGFVSLACGLAWLLLRERLATPRQPTGIHRT